jgi:hypothetical protein
MIHRFSGVDKHARYISCAVKMQNEAFAAHFIFDLIKLA